MMVPYNRSQIWLIDNAAERSGRVRTPWGGRVGRRGRPDLIGRYKYDHET